MSEFYRRVDEGLSQYPERVTAYQATQRENVQTGMEGVEIVADPGDWVVSDWDSMLTFTMRADQFPVVYGAMSASEIAALQAEILVDAPDTVVPEIVAHTTEPEPIIENVMETPIEPAPVSAPDVAWTITAPEGVHVHVGGSVNPPPTTLTTSNINTTFFIAHQWTASGMDGETREKLELLLEVIKDMEANKPSWKTRILNALYLLFTGKTMVPTPSLSPEQLAFWRSQLELALSLPTTSELQQRLNEAESDFHNAVERIATLEAERRTHLNIIEALTRQMRGQSEGPEHTS